MTDIKKNDIVDIDDFVDSLCERNGISLSEVYDCAKDHYDELQTIDRIFKLETEEDIRRCMALARILTPKWADSIIAFSRREKFNKVKLNWIEEPEISVYSLMLVSAFIYNPVFLKKAWNWCAITYQEARYQETAAPEGEEIKPDTKNPRHFPYNGRDGSKKGRLLMEFPLNMRESATSEEDEEGDREISRVDSSWQGISYEGVCIDRQDETREYRISVKDTKGHENFAKLELVLMKEKEDEEIRVIPLYRLKGFENPETLVYSTGEIPNLEKGARMFLREIAEDNNA
jgi:hypothetical protein